LVLWAIFYKQELQSGFTRWLDCEQYLVPSNHRAVCNWDLWQLISSLCKVVQSVVVFARWQKKKKSCSIATTLAGQLLPPARWGNSVLCKALKCHEISSKIHHAPV
jgi:hypothetical protein